MKPTTHDEVLVGIRDILKRQLGLDDAPIPMEAHIQADLGADSLDVMEIGMTIEERFDIAISDASWEGVETVGDLADLVLEIAAPEHGVGRD
jgi:acyl carrier protein